MSRVEQGSAPRTHVALGVDAGELPEGDDDGEEPPLLYALCDLVAAACGGHAGDPASMERVARASARHGLRLLAHPSYPDREGFGRRSMPMHAELLEESVRRQCEALRTIARAAGVRVIGVKPHGALYHDAARDPAIAQALVRGAAAGLGDLELVVAPPDALFASLARESGADAWVEGFADRGYTADGALIARGSPGALVLDPADAASQAARLAASGRFDVLCLHADAPGVLARARAVRAALDGSRAW